MQAITSGVVAPGTGCGFSLDSPLFGPPAIA